MSLILPRRFKSQPQYPARLDPAHPLFKDLVLAYSAGRGLHDGKHGFGSIVGTMLQGAGQSGRYIQTSDASSYAQFASLDDYNVLGEITVVVRIRTGSLGSQQAIAIKSEGGGGTNTPFGLLIESDGSVSLNRANSGGGTPFRVWASAAKLSANTDFVIAVTQGGDISVAPGFYINGIFDTGFAASLYGGGGVGGPTATAEAIKLGNRTDLATRFLGQIYDTVILKRSLTTYEVADLSRNVQSIWKAPKRRIWIASATTAHNLSAENAAQTNVASTGSISQAHALSGQPSAQTNAASAAGITQSHALTGAASAQANATATGAITQAHVLTGSASSQANTASTGSVSQGAQFAAAPSDQVNTAATGAITQDHALAGSASTQAQAALVASITQAHALVAANATQSNTAPASAISTGVVHNLTASASVQANTGTAGAITQAHVLIAAPSVQDNIAAASAIVQAHILAASSAAQGNTASTGAITAGDNVLVSVVERTATFRRSKSVTVRFN